MTGGGTQCSGLVDKVMISQSTVLQVFPKLNDSGILGCLCLNLQGCVFGSPLTVQQLWGSEARVSPAAAALAPRDLSMLGMCLTMLLLLNHQGQAHPAPPASALTPGSHTENNSDVRTSRIPLPARPGPAAAILSGGHARRLTAPRAAATPGGESGRERDSGETETG